MNDLTPLAIREWQDLGERAGLYGSLDTCNLSD